MEKQSLSSLLNRLLKGLLSGNEETRKKARDRIDRLGVSIVPDLILATKNSNPDFRWVAVDSLGSIQDFRASSAVLERVLFDEDVHVRWRSIWAVTKLDDGSVIPTLLEMLNRSDETIAWNAAVALSVFGRTEASSVLLTGLKSNDDFQRWEAVNALGTIRDCDSVPTLVSLLEQNNHDIRREVVLSLGRIGGKNATTALLRSLNKDKDPEVRWRAAMALGWTGDREVIPFLRNSLQTEVEEYVKDDILEAIRTLEGKMELSYKSK